jgi:hypothetical protein
MTVLGQKRPLGIEPVTAEIGHRRQTLQVVTEWKQVVRIRYRGHLPTEATAALFSSSPVRHRLLRLEDALLTAEDTDEVIELESNVGI